MSQAARPSESAVDRAQVRLVLGLRWRLLVRDARARPLAFAGRIVALLVGLGVIGLIALALGAAVAVFQGRGERLAAEALLHLSFAAAFLWLALGPLLAFRANEFLDVTKLFHLPVNHRTVFVASLVGAFLSPTALAALGPVVGVSVGFGGGVPAVLGRIGVGMLVVLVGVVAGQAVLLALLNTLRSRIWRDVLLVVGPLLAGGVFIALQILIRGSEDDAFGTLLETLHGWLPWLAPLPSWWGAHPAVSPPGVAWLPALGLPLLAWALVRAAARLQEKAYHGELWAPPRQGVRKAGGRRWFAFLPDPVAALAEKDLKLLFREPVVRVMVVQQGIWALFPVALTLWRVLTTEGPSEAEGVGAQLPFLPLAAFVVLMMELGLLMNLLGLEAGGYVHTLLTPVRASQVLYGKVVAHLAVFGGANAFVAFLLAVLGYTWAGAPGEGVLRGLLDGALLFVATATALGLCVVASVHLPVRLAARGRRALRQQASGRDGCLLVVKNLVATGTVGFAVLPAVFLVHHADVAALFGRSLGLPSLPGLTALLGLVLAGVIAYGAVRLGVHAAAESAERRVESLVGRLARSED